MFSWAKIQLLFSLHCSVGTKKLHEIKLNLKKMESICFGLKIVFLGLAALFILVTYYIKGCLSATPSFSLLILTPISLQVERSIKW